MYHKRNYEKTRINNTFASAGECELTIVSIMTQKEKIANSISGILAGN
jgi:hypothetical protein